MRTAYLHIGLEKTGTTSVQIFLRTNSDLLEKYNLEYLGHEEKPYVHGIAHFPIAASFYKECPDFIPLQKHKPSSEILRALSQDAAATDSDIILSCEHFSSRLHNVDNIEAIGAALSPRKIKVICYLRRQDEQAVSLYSTLVKGGLTKPFAISDINPEHRYYNYRQILGDWAKVFGKENIIIREYNRKLLIKGDIRADFLDILGIDIDGISFTGNANPSLDSLQVEMLRRVNHHLPPFVPGGSKRDMENFQRSQDVRTMLMPVLPEGVHIRALMTASDRQTLMDHVKNENLKIIEAFTGTEFIKKWHCQDMKPPKSLGPEKLAFVHFEKALVASGLQLVDKASDIKKLDENLNDLRAELNKICVERDLAISENNRLKAQRNKSLKSKIWKKIKRRFRISR